MIDIPEELVDVISQLKSQQMTLIAIDGCGGAGKSTFAKKLAHKLGNSQVVHQVVHIDDFYKSKENRIKITERTPVHSNFEFERLKQQVLKPLKNGDTAIYQTTDGRSEEIKPDGYVIIEGLGTLGSQLKNYFNYKIWIDSSKATRRRRGIERDSEEWTKIWDVEYLPQDSRYMREQLPHKEADWVLTNS